MTFSRVLLGGVAALALTLAASAAGATVIDFDDIPVASGTPISHDYDGLVWNNFDALNAVSFEAFNGPSGYSNGLVSSPNVALNGYGDPASFGSASPFTLNSLYLTGAWKDGLSVVITGLLDGAVVDTATEVVSSSGPTHVMLDWTGIDQVDFASSGGVNHGYTDREAAPPGEQFVLDNVTLNAAAVPEPATWAMLILGLGMIGYAARRRRGSAVLAA